MDRANYFAKYTKDDLALINLFKEELSNINLLYLQAINSQDITKANSLIKKMGAISKTLEAEYGDRATKRIPQEYLLGAKYIDDTLSKEASYIAINKANTKELAGMVKEMGTVHVEAVNALLNNSKNYIKSSLDGMERQALSMLNDLQQEKVRETLARSVISGDNLQTMKDKVVKYFKDNQITTFKDRSGKTRSLDRYADMLTRTETSIANIQGTLNRAIQLGITKFKVVEQADCCEICSEYRNEVVDITDGTVDLPPYHPNCRGYVIALVWEQNDEIVQENNEIDSDDIQNRKATTPEERTRKALDIIENSTMYLEHEQASLINKNGDIIRTYAGNSGSVKCFRADITEPYILTHNHPNSSSFSKADLRGWYKNGLEHWIRASSKIGTYSLYAERPIDKLLFMKKYVRIEWATTKKAHRDMEKIATAWRTWSAKGLKDYVRFKDGTVLTYKDDPIKFSKLTDEHLRKYYREAMDEIAKDTPGVKFEYIENTAEVKNTDLNKMYLNKIEELTKLKRRGNKNYEDNIDLNNLL